MPVTIEEAREVVATAAEANGETKFAREVRAGAWDSRSDIQAALNPEDYRKQAEGERLI